MKAKYRFLMAAAVATLTFTAQAQTENPRGIYRMLTLTGKTGEIIAPFEQYKICTDSVTLMLNINQAVFRISNTDHKVFNYTGSQPQNENDKSTLIYDSNADHFTLKWWSSNIGHIYFPENDWCIEKYVAGQYSDMARKVLETLTATPSTDPQNPLIGTWRILGDVDELRGIKKVLPKMHEQYASSKYYNTFYIFTPNTFALVIRHQGGVVNPITYYGKKSYQLATEKVMNVKWLNKNLIAIEEHIEFRTDYKILERINDDQTMLSRIASQHLREQR